MPKRIIIWLLALVLVPAMLAFAGDPQWAVKGDYTESCSCNPACPCLFGSMPTHPYCKGNALLEIKEGSYGDVSLDGVSAVFTFSFGKWVKYYVGEEASDEQAEAVEKLATAVFQFPATMMVLSTEKVPVSIERTATTVKFSVPASTVEIEMMEGWDGKPIKIHNLPYLGLADYTQYKSVTTAHQSEDKEFSYSGTNGLTSWLERMSEE